MPAGGGAATLEWGALMVLSTVLTDLKSFVVFSHPGRKKEVSKDTKLIKANNVSMYGQKVKHEGKCRALH